MNTHTVGQSGLLSIFNLLPESKQQQLIDFALFLWKKEDKDENPVCQSVKAVEETWGTVELPRHIMKHIAENKEIEYEFLTISHG
ncbi:MAG: hypothetical protein AB7S75_25100 [Desulfococcaceae bacterium]